jgi:hypothetical protein
MTLSRSNDTELLARADALIEFYAAEPQGIGTAKPCECAQRAIDQGHLTLDPDCKAHGCKELRR